MIYHITRKGKESKKMTDWIQLFIEDRHSMAKIMRNNIASDVLAGYSLAQITRQMVQLEDYERETEFLLAKFRADWNPERRAYEHMKRVGAIA